METAIVMPLNLFLLLSILQYGLISQARYMAKFAAYRAARVGSMNHANKSMMEAAALASLLPVLTTPHTVWAANAGDPAAAETILPTNSAGSILKKVALFKIPVAGANELLPGWKMVDVSICGPAKTDLTSITQRALHGSPGSSKQVDFDDPQATEDATGWSPDTDLKKFLATKLRVQVKLNYVMPIPFANWIISRSYLVMLMPDILRMNSTDNISPLGKFAGKLLLANQAHVYIAPIFESYAIRMQSNYFLNADPLPATYGAVDCVSWAKPNPDK